MGSGLTNVDRIKVLLMKRLTPAFMIVGVQKAGTSALFAMLAKHPGILAPTVKEMHFFDRPERYLMGIKSYLSGFPRRPLRGTPLTFEATPSYVFVDEALGRVHKHFPFMKLVIVLRDPVHRAYSAWNMFRQINVDENGVDLRDGRSFADAVEEELSGIEVASAHQYLARGDYAPQISRAFDIFGRDKVLLVAYPRLKHDPRAVVNDICEFVGIHAMPTEVDLGIKSNVRPYSSRIDQRLYEHLREYYSPRLEALWELIGERMELNEAS